MSEVRKIYVLEFTNGGGIRKTIYFDNVHMLRSHLEHMVPRADSYGNIKLFEMFAKATKIPEESICQK